MDRRRLLAGFIDFLLAAITQSALMFIFIIPQLAKESMTPIDFFLINIQLTLVSVGYLIIRDILGSRSIGKRICKLKIVNNDTNKNASVFTRFLRNLTWLFGPVDIFVLLLMGYRIGDKLANTKVVPISKNAM
jgi:uncharacterized RDD family membrane protein YckC